MKLRIIILIALLLLFSSAALIAQPVDLIVLLDISESLLPVFEDILDYLIRDILQSHLQFGDYFHLLAFAGSTHFELSEQVNSTEDIERILKRVFLLQPLGTHTDIVGAIQYIYQYAVDLPVSRPKTILMLTDGIHDPPPKSPFQPDRRDIKQEIFNSAVQFANKRWDFRIVLLPEGVRPQEGAPVITELKEALKAEVATYPKKTDESFSNKALGNPSIKTEENLGKIGKEFALPIYVTNHDSQTRTFRLLRLYLNGENVLLNNPEINVEPKKTKTFQAEVLLPDGIDPGECKLTFVPEFSNGRRFSPKEIGVTVVLTGRDFFQGVLPWKITILILLGLLAAALLILFLVKFRKNLDAIFMKSTQSERFDEHESIPVIELIVEGQNKEIGLRNVHSLAQGHSLCVGGGGSPFVIFLYPFPPCIGRIKNEDGTFLFVAEKKGFFPPNAREVSQNCLEKRMRAVSQTGKNVTFYFRKYISPLERINRIMGLTQKPGLSER
jgi:hypothetical protein